MACFLAPVAQAIGTSIAQKKVGREKAERWKLGWLNKLLWGGSALLAVEHAWHGEIVPRPPFLTAMQSPEDIPVMLKEILVVGVPMAAVVTLVWGIMVVVARRRGKAVLREAEAKGV
jgi:hypothetical protein